MATFEPWAVGDTPSLALYPGERALQSLISGTIPQGERTSLIEKILSSRGAAHMIGYLQESDAQTFIDIVDEVRRHSPIPKGCIVDFAFNILYPERHWRTSISRHSSEESV